MIESELFQGFGYWGFFSALGVSALAVLYPMTCCSRYSFRCSTSLTGLIFCLSTIVSVCSDKPWVFGWGALVAASCFGWWLFAIGVCSALDRRNEA